MRYRKTAASPNTGRMSEEESPAEREAFEQLVRDYRQSMEKLEEIIMPEVVRKRRWRAEHSGTFARWLQRPEARFRPWARIGFVFLCIVFCFFVVQSVRNARIPAFSYVLTHQPAVSPAAKDEPSPVQETVSVNTASAEELIALPGIGAALAQRIVAEREANGAFRFPEDLLAVSGIGTKKLEAIRTLIDFDE